MNRSGRTMSAVLLAACLVVTGCANDSKNASGGSGGESKRKIWYVNPLANTPDWGRSADQFKKAAGTVGFEGTLVGPTKIDVPAMVSQMEQAIAGGANGIITCPLEPAAFQSVIKQARDKGIVVAAIGCVDDHANFSVGTGNEEYGAFAADLIAEQTGGKAKVGILGTDQTTPNQVAQVQGFRARIKEKYPDIKEVVWESDKSDAGIAAQKMTAMISAYPEMDYLWIIEGGAPGAVPAAFQEAGKKPGDVKVLAIDAQESTIKAIQDGWITSTLNQCWFDTTPNIAKLILEALDKKTTPQSFYKVPVDAISKENLPYKGCPQNLIDQAFVKS